MFSSNPNFDIPIIENFTEDNLDLSSNYDISNIRYDLSDINNESLLFLINNESEREDTTIRPIFKTEICNKKRGRKFNKESKKQEHTASDPDNIKRKIQVHFLTFIVSLINDCLRTFCLDDKISFLNFDYKKKEKISKEYLHKIKNSSVKEIIENMGISKKHKRNIGNKNKENLEILEKIDWFQKLFEINYLDLFSLYYNNQRPLKHVSLFYKNIIISGKTKPFYHLLQKYKESKEYMEIINMAKLFVLSENDNKEKESDKKDVDV